MNKFWEKTKGIVAGDGEQLLPVNRLLSAKKTLVITCVLMDAVLLLFAQYLFNLILNIPLWVQDLDHPGNYMGLRNIFPIMRNITKIPVITVFFFLVIGLLIVIIDVSYIYKTRSAFGENTLNIDQKGEARWTTNEEIKAQYRCIPDRDVPFEGAGGTIISRIGRKLYIDHSPTNNLIIGITRSGKGEMFVFPSIDVYSRAEEKTSLVITDPKLELFKSSKQTLIDRGYDVYLLNLDDPLHSMGFNPLEQIKEEYLNKNYAEAELLAQAFSFSIFNPNSPTNTDSFWQDTAASLLTAMIMAHIQDCVEADERINERRHQQYKQRRNLYDSLPEERQKKERAAYIDFINKYPERDPITDPGIYYLPDDVEFEYTRENEKKINMYSIINTFTELARQKSNKRADISMLDIYFAARPPLDRAKLKYAGIEVAGDRTKGSIYASMLTKLTIFTFENIAKMTAESSLKLDEIGWGEKPVAVFLGIPDYDKSAHFLATVFIRQVTFVLEKRATRTKSGKCPRKVKFICDEFGNLPAIEGMESIITLCLGRNISFDLYIQSLSQGRKLYGDDADTIFGNCGNQIYILTNDDETSENFSRNLGSRTMVDISRSGGKLSLDKNYTETTIEKRLLNMNQLEELREGECVVKRVMRRRDLKQNRIRPTPIFNSEESGKRFLFRYEYLTDTFPNPDEIDLRSVNTEDRSHINHMERVWDPEKSFQQIAEKDRRNTREPNVQRMKELADRELIIDKMSQFLSEEEMTLVKDPELPVVRLLDLVQRSGMTKSEKRQMAVLIGTVKGETIQ